MNKLVLRNTGTLHAIYYDDENELVYGKDLDKLLYAIRKHKKDIKKLTVKNGNIEFEYKDLIIELNHKGNFEEDRRFKYIFDMLRKKKYKLFKTKSILIASGLILVSLSTMISEKDVKSSPASSIVYEDADFSNEIEKKIEGHELSSDLTIENNEKTEKKEEKKEEKEKDIRKDLNIGKDFDSNKYKVAKAYYYDLISKYAKTYGLDPDLMLAIGVQERGIHSTTMDSGGATGLFQIQNSVWVGQTIKAFNYDTNNYEYIHVTNDNIGDINQNAKIACAIFQNYLNNYMHGNVVAAVQSYNMGPLSVKKIINEYCTDCGKDYDAVLDNKEDLGWIRYAKNSSLPGDPNYVGHVLRYYNGDLNKLVSNEAPESSKTLS